MSDAMSTERLDEIRERSKDAMQAYNTGTVGTPPNIDGLTISEALDYVGESAEDVPELLAHVDHLTAKHERARADWKTTIKFRTTQRNEERAKNARLRKGIEALEKSMRANWGDRHRDHSPYEMGCQTCAADVLRDLLNPPTEGGTDDPA